MKTKEMEQAENKSTLPITDNCPESTRREAATGLVSERVFPCRPNDEIQVALAALLRDHMIGVEVAGGIVRHHRW